MKTIQINIPKFILVVALISIIFQPLFSVDFRGIKYVPDYPSLPRQDCEFSDLRDSSFFAYTNCTAGFLYRGYPYHSSLVQGINDTCLVYLEIRNSNYFDKDIRYEQPETWVIPYIYNRMGDMQHNRPAADTSGFNYCFAYWARLGAYTMIPKPDTLLTRKNGDALSFWNYNPCALVFKLWDIPLGLKAVELKKTSSAPSDLELIRWFLTPPQYWYVEPKDMRDTLNAYIDISEMTYRETLNFSQALTWIDTVFAYNDSSLAGWMVKAGYSDAQQDSLQAIQDYSRVMSIFTNNSDPCIDFADTTLSPNEKSWGYYNFKMAEYRIWAWQNGRQNDKLD